MKHNHSWSKVITPFDEGVWICNYCSGLSKQTDDIVVGHRISDCRLVSNLIQLQHSTIWDSLSAMNYSLCLSHSSRDSKFVKARFWLFVVIIGRRQDCTPSSRTVSCFIETAFLLSKLVILFVINRFKQTFNIQILSTSLKYRFEIFSLWVVMLPTRWWLMC